MRSVSLLILIIGLLLIVIGYMEQKQYCGEPKVEYRYIPRNFYEEQNAEIDLKNMYNNMFNGNSVWNKYPHGNNIEKKNSEFLE